MCGSPGSSRGGSVAQAVFGVGGGPGEIDGGQTWGLMAEGPGIVLAGSDLVTGFYLQLYWQKRKGKSLKQLNTGHCS